MGWGDFFKSLGDDLKEAIKLYAQLEERLKGVLERQRRTEEDLRTLATTVTDHEGRISKLEGAGDRVEEVLTLKLQTAFRALAQDLPGIGDNDVPQLEGPD